MEKPQYGYVGFVEGQRVEVHAESLYAAQQKVRAAYKGRKKYPSVNVMLAELPNGEPYVQRAVD
jgi:hypothetical protein